MKRIIIMLRKLSRPKQDEKKKKNFSHYVLAPIPMSMYNVYTCHLLFYTLLYFIPCRPYDI